MLIFTVRAVGKKLSCKVLK